MSKSVLYLSYDGMTDPLGQSQVLPYLIGLCNAGYTFHIISFEKPDAYGKEESTIRTLIEGHSITWHPLKYHKTPPIASTLWDLFVLWKKAKQLLSQHNIQLIHGRSYLAGLIGLGLKQKLGIRFLFDIRGFWADERVDGGLWNLKHPMYRLIYQYFKRKEIAMMHGADHVISLTHAGKKEIVSGNLFHGKAQGVEPEKITVIPCAVDMELFNRDKINPADQLKLKEKLNLQNIDRILIYLGSLGTWYLLDEMLLYFRQYHNEHPKSIFLCVTKDDPEMIWVKAEQLGINRRYIRITSAQREKVPLHLSIATLGIFFIKSAYSKKASSAVKMGEMLSMGLDIVCNKIGDVSQFELDKTETRVLTEVVGISGKKNLEKLEAYSLSSGISRYQEVYAKLLNGG